MHLSIIVAETEEAATTTTTRCQRRRCRAHRQPRPPLSRPPKRLPSSERLCRVRLYLYVYIHNQR